MHQRGGRDQTVSIRTRVGYMQRGATTRHRSIDRQNPVGKALQHLIFEPGSQQGALRRIAARNLQDADLELLQNHHRQIEARPRYRSGPCRHMLIRFAGTHLSQLGDYVGIE